MPRPGPPGGASYHAHAQPATCRRLRYAGSTGWLPGVHPGAGVDRPDAGTGVAGSEPECDETRDDYFTEHGHYLR